MATVTTQIEGTGSLDPRFVDDAIRETLPKIAARLEAEARVNLNPYVKTGKTLANLQSKLNLDGPNPSVEVGVYGRRGFIARFLETGVSAHTIKPKRKKILAFNIGGKRIWARSVRHPGFPASHWLTRATRSIFPNIEPEIQSSIERTAKARLTPRAGASNGT